MGELTFQNRLINTGGGSRDGADGRGRGAGRQDDREARRPHRHLRDRTPYTLTHPLTHSLTITYSLTHRCRANMAHIRPHRHLRDRTPVTPPEYGTCKTVTARFWSRLCGKCPQTVSSCGSPRLSVAGEGLVDKTTGERGDRIVTFEIVRPTRYGFVAEIRQ